MWKSSERRRSSFGQHGMINRSDSEKLSDQILIFKPEVHLQSAFSGDKLSVKNVDSNSISLEDMEYFDVPQSPCWPSADSSAVSKPSYGRRRTSVIALAATCNDGSERTAAGLMMASYRRESRVDASIEEKEERILEVLREIVRKCTNPVSTSRPTAGQVMNIFDASSIAVRDK